jgi:hypothetical protein
MSYLSKAVAVLAVFLLFGSATAASVDLQYGDISGNGTGARDIQETIWFQGFVADSGTGEPVNASYNIVVEIFDAAVSGSSVWGPETHTATSIVEGWFNVELGSVVTPLPAFDTPPYYLAITINGELLDPRLKLASVPSAFQSHSSDDGLVLPYYGEHDSSGDAFSIRNTGGNICGEFEINNASSTAGALYGKHNGEGAAVIAWHNGVGPAVKGVANGSGIAGEFIGAVTVSDSLSVGGRLRGVDGEFEGSVAVAGTLACGGFWLATDPTPGYSLVCQDGWGGAAWAPPNVIDVSRVPATAQYVTDTLVHQYQTAEVTLTVPGPGYIDISSSVWFVFDHTSGTADKLRLSHSTSTTSHDPNQHHHTFWEIPTVLGTTSDLDKVLQVHSMHEVDEGTHTYYLVGSMDSGVDGADRFAATEMRAIYYPYPIPVAREFVPQGEAGEGDSYSR